MNIFFLDKNPYEAAKLHCDQHVNKMITESAQMLSTARRLYLPGHPAETYNQFQNSYEKHPCTIWTGESWVHALWLYALADGLNTEFQNRRDKSKKPQEHDSYKVIRSMMRADGYDLSEINISDLYKSFKRPPALSFGIHAEHLSSYIQKQQDNTLTIDDAVSAYRYMYLLKNDLWKKEAAQIIDQYNNNHHIKKMSRSDSAKLRRIMTWHGKRNIPEQLLC